MATPHPGQSDSHAVVAEDLTNISIDAPVISSHNDYLLDQSNVIRARTIPWEGYQKASLITESELSLIRQFTNQTKNSEQYVSLFLTLLGKLSRVDTIQSILVLIDDFITGTIRVLILERNDTPKLFIESGKKDLNSVFSPFFKLLVKDDEYIQLKAAKIVTFLLVESKLPYPTDPSELFAWIVFQLASTNPNVVDISIQLLQSLLSILAYRKAYFQQSGSIQSLLDILKKPNVTAQVQYQTIYCFWLLSFDPELAGKLEKIHHIIPFLKDIAKSAIKEKVVRINMILKSPNEVIIPMLGYKLLPAIEVLSVRKWSDPEIAEDLTFLRDELSHHVASLSTFDEYASEVRSSKLEWSPPHQSEQFWKTNASRLNENQYELIKIIENEPEPVTLAVAAHDLGQYVKYGNNARKVLEETSAKTAVMGLMSHSNADVRYEALAAVQ
ncbi:H(+)-transporting V1 sector ATPase subunit H [Globomyces sp. JEL0801]|nr:H(+)-transporting V1 sector ATPase subunit H [Globomyces sp. JEL0801]